MSWLFFLNVLLKLYLMYLREITATWLVVKKVDIFVGVHQVEFFLSVKTPKQFSGFKNVTRVLINKVASSKWVRDQFWPNYPFKDSTTARVSLLPWNTWIILENTRNKKNFRSSFASSCRAGSRFHAWMRLESCSCSDVSWSLNVLLTCPPPRLLRVGGVCVWKRQRPDGMKSDQRGETRTYLLTNRPNHPAVCLRGR